MGVPNRQIGWSQESNLLWYILSQLKRLTSIIFSLKEAATPKYKVYTALLTQSGGDFLDQLDSSTLTQNVTKGVTYTITNASDGDFLNVGAPNNNIGTSFVAINNSVPTLWGESGAALLFNTGAPVVTVLENTIGNIWFTYDEVGNYVINSNGLFTVNKTVQFINSPLGLDEGILLISNVTNTDSLISLVSTNSNPDFIDGLFNNTPIEIRVYN